MEKVEIKKITGAKDCIKVNKDNVGTILNNINNKIHIFEDHMNNVKDTINNKMTSAKVEEYKSLGLGITNLKKIEPIKG